MNTKPLVTFKTLYASFSNSFRKKRERSGEVHKIKVATLGRRIEHSSSFFFHYEPVKPRNLLSLKFREEDYQGYSALFIYPSSFFEVIKEDHKFLIQEIATKIPVVFMGANRLIFQQFTTMNSDYEKLAKNFYSSEYIQVVFYFLNGDSCFFQMDSFNNENQRELSQAIKFMQHTNSYIEWEREYYEY